MEQNSLEDFRKHTANRFEAVVVAAKYARRKNQILNEEEALAPEGEEEDKPRMEMIISSALKEVIQGKVKFERPKIAGRKFGK
jgi:DNA-directed RNA polymerase omega subunit